MLKKLLGHVGVDSGQLMVTDPCYVRQFLNNEYTTHDSKEIDSSYSYNGSCNQTCKTENQGGELGNGLGLSFSTGFGDGTYPVYAHYQNVDGFGTRVKKIEIEFFTDDSLEDDDEIN